MELGICILTACGIAASVSAWRIWRIRHAVPHRGDGETIGQLNDRMEREFAELFRKWEN